MRILLAVTIAIAIPTFAPAQALKAPPGFEVVEFADGKLANDIHCLTVDPKGRVIVSGRGYIRILVDDNHDGKADRAIQFASTPKDGAMGLLWERDTLFVTGDGGLRQFTSKNGEKADGPSKLIRAMKTGGEHSSHAIRRGPDGWLYVIGGNNAGIDHSYAELPTSPVKEPIAGCVLRFHPTTWKCEIVAHGFRNPYGMDFNLAGDLFTYDSDNERCVSLPWYEPTRFYHVIEARHYGWLNPQYAVTWRRPPYFCDCVAPIATLGRGSPTGVACYRHNQFPPEYHGGFFLCDWTFGKVHFASLERKGASYTAKTRVFLESQGDNGFAPTACAIDDKTGDLYVSIGGRGTRGAVYRVRDVVRFKALGKELVPFTMVRYSREANDGLRKEIELRASSKSPVDRLWALQMTRRHLPIRDGAKLAKPLFGDEDRAVRMAAIDILEDALRVIDGLTGHGRGNIPAIIEAYHARLRDPEIRKNWPKKKDTRESRLEFIRMNQIELGDIGAVKSIGTIWEGYTPRAKGPAREIHGKPVHNPWAEFTASGDMAVDREQARYCAMYGFTSDASRLRILNQCSAKSSPVDDIHYLACYARLGGTRDAKEAKLVADALLDLDAKIAARKLNRDSNWAPRVRELFIGLVEKDAALPQAMLDHPAFGRADHALFANVDGFPKAKAARVFLARWQRDKDYALNGNIVALFESLPSGDVLPTIRKRWGESGQESAFLPLLAKKPVAADRARFIAGLNSPQSSVVSACVAGLDKLAAKSDAEEGFALIRALHRMADVKPGKRNPAPYGARLAKAIASRLEKTTGQTIGPDSKRWIAWLEKTHPEFGKRVANPDGVDVAKWDTRLARLDWAQGDADAGKIVFAKASCVQCHSGSQALGPDLVGAAKRFSRGDLFTSILQPSKDVPARYQMTVIENHDGKTHQGIIIYDAVDNLLLQSGAAMTIRVPGASIASRTPSTQSLMPAGLLDPLSDREIVDLYAYLRRIAPEQK